MTLLQKTYFNVFVIVSVGGRVNLRIYVVALVLYSFKQVESKMLRVPVVNEH